jgi:hypothetical protein
LNPKGNIKSACLLLEGRKKVRKSMRGKKTERKKDRQTEME